MGVQDAVRKLTRSSRITTAIETPVLRRTAEQAALIAVANLIQVGVFR